MLLCWKLDKELCVTWNKTILSLQWIVIGCFVSDLSIRFDSTWLVEFFETLGHGSFIFLLVLLLDLITRWGNFLAMLRRLFRRCWSRFPHNGICLSERNTENTVLIDTRSPVKDDYFAGEAKGFSTGWHKCFRRSWTFVDMRENLLHNRTVRKRTGLLCSGLSTSRGMKQHEKMMLNQLDFRQRSDIKDWSSCCLYVSFLDILGVSFPICFLLVVLLLNLVLLWIRLQLRLRSCL